MKAKKIPRVLGQASVFAGIEEGQFKNITARDRKALLTLMARISEASFRRGIHHSVSCLRPVKLNLFDLRYGRSLDKSPSPHGPAFHPTTSSVERLLMEYDGLSSFGMFKLSGLVDLVGEGEVNQ